MQPTLYLHIGAHKTGTTTLQNSLYDSRDELKKLGIKYLNNFSTHDKIHFVHQVGRLKLTNSVKYNKGVVQSGKNYFSGVIDSDIDKYILSYEGFCGSNWKGYKNSDVVSKMLREMTSEFHVKIIIYIRRQDQFIESLYSQYIKEGHTISFEDFLNSIDESMFNWHSIIENFNAEFGKENIYVRNYDKIMSKEGGDVVKDFAGLLNLDPLNVFFNSTRRANKSLSYDLLELKRFLNIYSKKIELNHDTLYKNIKQNIIHEYTYLTKDERKNLVQMYSASNRELIKKYLNGDHSILLKSDTDKVTFQGLKAEQINQVIMDSGIFKVNISASEKVIVYLKKVKRKLITFIRREN